MQRSEAPPALCWDSGSPRKTRPALKRLRLCRIACGWTSGSSQVGLSPPAPGTGGPAGKWHTVAWRDAGVWTETQERRIPDSVKAGASLEGGDPRAQGHRRLAKRRRAHLHGERAAWPRTAPTARGSASGLASLLSSNASLKKG